MFAPAQPLALVIGDNTSFCRIVGDTLGAGGFRYEASPPRVQALELWKCNQHDLVILDHEDLSDHGLQICRGIRSQQQGSNIPILLVGRSGEPSDLGELLEIGFTDFVSLQRVADLLLHKAHYLVRSSQTLNALEASLEQLRETQQLARMGMWSWLPDGELLRFDDNALLLGAQLLPHEVSLEKYLRLVHPDDRQAVRAAFFELSWGGEHRIEYRLVDLHGREHFFSQRGSAFLRRGEIHFNGTLQDITAQRQSADRLVMLQDALDSLPLGITISDLDGHIIYTNPAEEEQHGYARGELAGLPVSLLGPGKGNGKGRSAADRRTALGQWGCWTRESINQRKDGRLFPVRLHSGPVRDTSGRVVGVVTACEELTNPASDRAAND